MGSGKDVEGSARERLALELHRGLTVEEILDIYFDHVPRLVGADAVGVYLFERPGRSEQVVRSTAPHEFMQRYEVVGRPDDPVLDFVVTHRLPVEQSRLPAVRWEMSGARMALREAGLEHSMQAPIMLTESLVGTINFARAADCSGFRRRDVANTRYVSEHVSLAIERALRHQALGSHINLLTMALDRVSAGIVVTEPGGRQVLVNEPAEDLLTRPLLGGGQLAVPLKEHLAAFHEQGRRVSTLTLRTGAGTRVIVKSYALGGNGLVMTELHDAAEEDRIELPAWDVLSPREQEIASLVSQGLSTKEIADRAFVSQNTVKQHLKRIFAKTDVHNRAELIQMIWAARRRAEEE